MMAQTKEQELVTLSIARIKKKVKMHCCGNSNRTLKDFVVDVINNSGESYADIAAECHLHTQTVKNLAEEKTQNPQHETINRIVMHFQIRLDGSFESVKAQYRNKPKV